MIPSLYRSRDRVIPPFLLCLHTIGRLASICGDTDRIAFFDSPNRISRSHQLTALDTLCMSKIFQREDGLTNALTSCTVYNLMRFHVRYWLLCYIPVGQLKQTIHSLYSNNGEHLCGTQIRCEHIVAVQGTAIMSHSRDRAIMPITSKVKIQSPIPLPGYQTSKDTASIHTHLTTPSGILPIGQVSSWGFRRIDYLEIRARNCSHYSLLPTIQHVSLAEKWKKSLSDQRRQILQQCQNAYCNARSYPGSDILSGALCFVELVVDKKITQ